MAARGAASKEPGKGRRSLGGKYGDRVCRQCWRGLGLTFCHLAAAPDQRGRGAVWDSCPAMHGRASPAQPDGRALSTSGGWQTVATADSQCEQVLRERTQPGARGRVHPSGEIAARAAGPGNVGALERPAWFPRGVRAVAMPGGPIEDQQGSRRAAGGEIPSVGEERVRNLARPNVRPPVGPGYEAGRSVVGAEFIHHQDESEERPICGIAIHIDVKALAGAACPERACLKGAELERAADDEAAGLEERRKHIDLVERGAAIDEICHPRRCGTDPHVCARRGVHREGVGLAQVRKPFRRDGAWEHDKAPLE